MMPSDLLQRAKRAAADVIRCESDLEHARTALHHEIRQLHLAGASYREIAEALGLSHQRVAQVIKAASESWWARLRTLGGVWSRGASLRCTSCGASDREVDQMVAGPDAVLCNRCVVAARTVLETASSVADPVFMGLQSGPEARCSFCGATKRAGRRVVGHRAFRICTTCLEASEAYIRGATEG